MSIKTYNQFITENNSVSFEEAYTQYWDELLRYCSTFTNDINKAEDYCQDAFVKIHKKFNLFDDKGSLAGWMKRVAKNTILDSKRREKVRRNVESPNSNEVNWETIDKSDDNEEPDDRSDDVLQAIEKLNKGQKEIFKLYYIDGLKHKEIAKHLGIDIGTSKSQLSRAKNKIREYIK